MDEQERAFNDRLPPRLPDGKDEMNLAEFPLCCISDRAQPDQKTLVFEDKVWDASRNEMVPRQLTITGSDRFGLPTATDDEVLVGMIQLSKLRHFAERSVFFTRYEMIRLLGWRDETKSYDRLETSMNRWVGVTLYYENAWWNREQQCWVNEKFHVLDNVTMFDREKFRRQSPSQTQLPLSHFTWNDVLFRSFKAGNLKGLDFDFFKGLDVPLPSGSTAFSTSASSTVTTTNSISRNCRGCMSVCRATTTWPTSSGDSARPSRNWNRRDFCCRCRIKKGSSR